MAVDRPQNPPVQSDARPTGATFADLGVPRSLCDVLDADGITSPFPIQTATLPDSIAGRDVLGRGRTGSGKTLAFVLPMLTRLSAGRTERRPGKPRALILAPTRELVNQIQDSILPLAEPLGLRTITVFGGVAPGPQINGLKRGVDIVVACPGRLEDHLRSRHVDLGSVEITVLDEADHMADLGFLPVVKRLLDTTPRSAQRLLFSATLDNGIDVLVKRYLTDPITHSVDSAQAAVGTMEHHVLHVTASDRLPVLVDLVSTEDRTMVFTRTKHRAKQLTRQLISAGVPSVEMHGNLAQNARSRNLAAFADGRATVLVATDIAARGIHVDDVTLVVHADPPIEHKAYLHRSGRTARAGAEGTVVTLATEEQRRDVQQLARKAGISPTVTQVRPGHPLLTELAPGERVRRDADEIAKALSVGVRTHQPAGTGKHRRRNPSRGPGGPKAAQGARSGGGQRSGGGSGGQRSGGGARPGGGAPGGGPRRRARRP